MEVCKKDLVILRFDDGSKAEYSRKNLSKLSEYFQILLTGGFEETEKNEIHLRHVDGYAMAKILQINFDNDSESLKSLIPNIDEAWKLIETADMLTLDANVIDKHVISQFINEASSRDILIFGHAFNRHNIVASTLRFLCTSKFSKFTETCENLGSIIDTNIFQEQGNISNTTYHPYIDVQSISNQYQVKHNFYIMGGYNTQAKTKCYKMETKHAYGSHLDKNNNKIESNFSNFTYVKSFPDQTIEDYRIVTVDYDIYITGGFDYEKNIATTAVWRYRVPDNDWHKIAPMKHARSFHCAVAVQNKLYVCGGYNGYKVHSSMEFYNEKVNKWISQPEMFMGVGQAACASYLHHLYVVCGQCGVKSIQTTNQIQGFDTLTKQWSYITQYKSPVFHPYSEYGLNCQFIEGVMYIFGGQTVRVDCYDLKSGEWKRLSDSNERRCDSTSLTFQGKLLLAGGIDFYDGTYHDTVEIYDKTKDTWEIMSWRMPEPLKNAGICYAFHVEKI